MSVKLKILTSLSVLLCLGWNIAQASILPNGTWTSTSSGDFDTGSNWSNTVVPTVSDNVVFNVEPTDLPFPPIVTITSDHTISNLDVINTTIMLDLFDDNTLTVTNDTDLALTVSDNATLFLANGTLKTANLKSGVNGEALFNITNGSTLEISSPLTITLGVNSGSDGKLAIDGVGSKLLMGTQVGQSSEGSIIVGNMGQGTFHVHNGASPTIDASIILGNQAGSTNSEIKVNDITTATGSTLTINNLTLSEATEVTTNMDIEDGSEVFADVVNIGKNGTSTVIVDGEGTDTLPSSFTMNDLNVGFNSTGNKLTIRKGASATVNNNISGLDAIIGVNNGSTGEIFVDGTTGANNPAQLDIQNRLVVGGSGSGTLRLDGSPGSAIANVVGDLIAGFNSDGNGYIEVGENSTLNVNTPGSSLVVGNGGVGNLNIVGGEPVGGRVFADSILVNATGPSGPTSQITIDYNGELTANNSVQINENGVIQMITSYSGAAELTSPTIDNFGLFKGAGNVNVDPGTTFNNFGTIAPDFNHSIDVTGDFDFETGSTFEVTILDAIDWSVLNIDGDLTFSSGFLDIILMGGTLPQLGDVFTVLTWTGIITGQFGSVDDEFGFNGNLLFQPIYNAQSLDLVVVPEPSTWALMGLGCLFIFWRIRRRS